MPYADLFHAKTRNWQAAGEFASSRTAAVLALMLAGWPVGRWYFARVTDGSDEPWGVLGLVAVLLLAPRSGWSKPLSSARRGWLIGMVILPALFFPVFPPTVRALFFVTAIGVVVGPAGFPVAWWTLLVLSLPVVPTIQFYLGYPLRLATTWLCVALLRAGDIGISSVGTTLRWAGECVIVDAPCSGIHMLWTGLFLAAALACHRRMTAFPASRFFLYTIATVFGANVLRAVAIFCIETHLWPSRPWAHEAVGLALFASSTGVIYFLSERCSPAQTPVFTAKRTAPSLP